MRTARQIYTTANMNIKYSSHHYSVHISRLFYNYNSLNIMLVSESKLTHKIKYPDRCSTIDETLIYEIILQELLHKL